MKRPSSLPVLMQVGALAALAVIASQAVAFGVILFAPPPGPAGFSVEAAATALLGRPARTTDGRPLDRRLASTPGVAAGEPDGLETAISAALASHLKTSPANVRVRLARSESHLRAKTPSVSEQLHVTIRRHSPGAATDPNAAEAPPVIMALPPRHGRHEQFITHQSEQVMVMANRLTFPPFTASLRLLDGRWATVEPPQDLIAPWHMRILLGLLISAILLAPLVWLLAQRLTRPIRVFAEAAERLGADPDAPPLAPTGPAEVRTAIAAFNDMQGKLRDHMRQRTQTIAAIAHDLRTPLTRLRFRAEQAPDAVRDRMATDIEEMDALIAQAMAFVRGEAAPERFEPFDLGALAADCATGLAETGAAVTFEGAGPLPVEGDPAALRRAIANLIDNALKFAGAAEVSAHIAGDQAIVRVDDRGPGLPDTELEAVFEPFQRGERSRSRETGGAGLGLAVARQAARAAGGDVTLANREGGGMAATLVLPLGGRGI